MLLVALTSVGAVQFTVAISAAFEDQYGERPPKRPLYLHQSLMRGFGQSIN
jgi:hypothetical protein